MTLNGAIMQLVEMRENSMMPEVFKPYLDKVIETVSECEEPSMMPEQRWIPCTPDTMPDDYTDVLVWFEYFRYGNYNCMYQTYGIGTYSTKYDSWMINHETGWRKLRVLAWMPLPEHYKGGRNDSR